MPKPEIVKVTRNEFRRLWGPKAMRVWNHRTHCGMAWNQVYGSGITADDLTYFFDRGDGWNIASTTAGAPSCHRLWDWKKIVVVEGEENRLGV